MTSRRSIAAVQCGKAGDSAAQVSAGGEVWRCAMILRTCELTAGDRVTANVTVRRRMDSALTITRVERCLLPDSLTVSGYTDANQTERILFRAVNAGIRWEVAR